MNVVLVGFMGSGKSKVGKRLAKLTGRTHIETDSLVTDGTSVEEIFAKEGEAGFRKRERAAVKGAAKQTDVVISTGGGTILDPANVRDLKRNGVVVYLKADESELIKRLTQSKRERPLLKGDIPGRVRELLQQRNAIYESVADVVVRSDARNADRVVEKIASTLSLNGAARTSRIRVGTVPPYTVSVGRGLLGSIELPKNAERAVVISHPRLRRLYGDALKQHTWLTFAEGEAGKTLETAAKLSEGLAKARLHRDDVVIALGGGVVGDVAGFVASTYGRGIGVIQIPTTLLAMVDSSIGGKTGVNLPQGKNLVGTFHQPLAVIADLDVLRTLPEREFRGGLAEVLKYAFIADPGLVKLLEKRDMHSVVTRSAKIKANVVGSDERDLGRRAILNYGHTLGHAIELASELHHGEAVSVGMVYAAIVAKLLDLPDMVDEHRRVLEAVGLPTTVEGLRWTDVRRRMVMDKKYAKGDRMVLLEDITKPVVRDVAVDILERAWKEL